MLTSAKTINRFAIIYRFYKLIISLFNNALSDKSKMILVQKQLSVIDLKIFTYINSNKFKCIIEQIFFVLMRLLI